MFRPQYRHLDFSPKKQSNVKCDDIPVVGIVLDSHELRIAALETQLKELTDGHKTNRDRIQENRAGVRASLAVLVFGAIVWGIPIASVKWSDDEFHFTRDTTSPELIVIGGLVASSLFAGEKPIDLIKSMIQKK